VDPDDWTITAASDVRFAHPRSWRAETDENPEGTSVYLQSDAVAFGVVGIYPPELEPEEIADQILDSLRDEHPGLEVEPREIDADTFPQGVAFEGLFMTLDTVAYCWVRSWRLPSHQTVVAYVQCVEKESADCEEIFETLCRSVAPSRR
jgi:hypothetical protein